MNREQLELRSKAFAVKIVAFSGETRKTPAWRSMADQLLDAATSAAANYRAAGRARSRAEFVAKLGIVNEESDETVYWLELTRDGNVGDRREVGLYLRKQSNCGRSSRPLIGQQNEAETAAHADTSQHH